MRKTNHTCPVPFLDLGAQYRAIKPEIDQAVLAVLESSQFILGDAVADFENRFAQYSGTNYAIGCSSGTAALHLALEAAGIGQGDEVIVPAMTFLATARAVDLAKGKPVLVDIDRATGTLNPELVERAITPRTKALLPVHLYGQMADMDPMLEIAERHGLVVIEDAAQAHGATQAGSTAGSMSHIGCFSFYPGKNLGAYGEAGCVVTNDEKLAQRITMLRDWGQEGKYNHVLMGFNYRMDGIQGAVLGVKLRYLEGWTEQRRQAARRYDVLLGEIGGLELPIERAGNRHVYHVYAMRVANGFRDELLQALQHRHINCGLHYPAPIHLQPCFALLGYRRGDFPEAESLADEELSLPMFPEITEEQQQTVALAIREFLHKSADAS